MKIEPYYADNHNKFYKKDCRDMNELNQNRFSGATIIQLLDGIKAIFSYLYLVRRYGFVAMPFSPFFTSTHFKQYLSLLMLNPKIRQKALNAGYGFSIGYRPSVKWLAIFSRWFLNAFVASEVLIKKVNNIWGYLLHPYLFGEYGVTSIASNTHMIGATLDSEIPITIKASSQIRLDHFFHISIIPHHPSGGQVKEVITSGEVLRR